MDITNLPIAPQQEDQSSPRPVPFTFIPGYLRFRPVYPPTSPQQTVYYPSLDQTTADTSDTSYEPFYTLPTKTVVRITKPPEPAQPLEEVKPVSEPSMSINSNNGAPATSTTPTFSETPPVPAVASGASTLPSTSAFTQLTKWGAFATKNTLQDTGSIKAGSSVETQTQAQAQAQASGPEADNQRPNDSADPSAKENDATTTDDDSHQTLHFRKSEGASSQADVPDVEQGEKDASLQPDVPDVSDVEQGGGRDATSQTDVPDVEQGGGEPILIQMPIGGGCWAAVAVFVETGHDVAQARLAGFDGVLASDYRGATPQQVGEVVAEALATLKDERLGLHDVQT